MKKWFWKFIMKHININVSSVHGDLYRANMYILAVRSKFQGFSNPDNIIFIPISDNLKLIISLEVNI